MEPADGPPINEVVLSISFGEQEALAGPKLLVALRQLISQYPDIEEQAPYEIPEELPTRRQLVGPTIPTIQIVGPSRVKRRYWLTAKDDKSILIQAQSDYFAVNWRVVASGSGYPRFAGMKDIFFNALSLFNNSIAEVDGTAIEARQVELSYINVVRLPADSTGHHSVGRYLDISAPFMGDFEHLNVAYTRSLEGSNGEFFGRSYAAVSSAYQILLDEPFNGKIDSSSDLPLGPVLNITTSVRSARHKSLTLDEISEILDREHVEASRSFRSVITNSAQESWGLE